jgi:UPF0755 protein
MNLKDNKWKIVGLTSVIVVILIGVFIFIQVGPYNKSNKNDILH